MANKVAKQRNGAVGFIDWLDAFVSIQLSRMSPACAQTMQAENEKAGYNEQETNDAKPCLRCRQERIRTADGKAADQQNDPHPNTRP